MPEHYRHHSGLQQLVGSRYPLSCSPCADSNFSGYYEILTMKNKSTTFDGTTFAELGGAIWRIRRFADEKDTRWSAFNPSIAYSPVHGYWVMVRSSNYYIDPEYGHAVATIGSRVQSKTWIGKLSEDLEIDDSTWREIDFSEAGIQFKRGAEDGRLFWRDGSWWFVAGLKEDEIYYPRIGLFRLDENFKAYLVEVHDCGWMRGVEKNWMPTYELNEDFDYVYSATEVYKDGAVTRRELTRETRGARGSSCLWKLDDDSYLAVVHFAHKATVERYNPRLFGTEYAKTRKYTHAFARYSKDGTLIGLSRQFIFENFKIEFAAGLVIRGDDVIVSYGKQDVASYLGKIKLDVVLKLIEEV